VAVATDEQWVGLRDALGRPDWATDPALATADGRRSHHDLIDDHLNAWCEQRSGDDIVEALWRHGVPVAKAIQPHRQSELPQLAVRGFFEDVDHPVNANTPHSTLPFTSTRGPDKFHAQPAPLLGQHNRELLAELGCSDKDIDELEAHGVIGTAPAMHGTKV
jgi:crotonobetainyl-CoA:carnitine CoA-transferase CaiB-like acyl-CoA transferase